MYVFVIIAGRKLEAMLLNLKEHLEIKSLKTVKVASHNISMNMFHQSR